MQSMFPQINVYHRPEEHVRLGLDVDAKCDECCAMPGKAGTTKPVKNPRGPRSVPPPPSSSEGTLDDDLLARLRARLD
jgi:hypothetical protein